MSIFRLSTLIVSLVLVGLVTARAEDLLVTQYKNDPSGAPYAIALEKGFFKKYGVAITSIISGAGGGSSVRAAMASDLGYGDVTAAPVIAAAAQGQDVKIVGITSRSLADLVVVGAGILAATAVLRADRDSAAARHALDESEARLAAIVESAMDAIITVDATQHIVLFNRAAEQIFGCPRADALGSPVERFLPERFRAAHHEHVRRFGTDKLTARRMGDATTLSALRADGAEFPIEASISHAELDGRPYFTVILRDTTLRKQYEDTLRQQQQELRELSAQVLEAREEEKTLLARELHDELGQLLTALKMDVGWLRERLPPQAPDLGDKARQMGELLDQTVASVRRISADLGR